MIILVFVGCNSKTIDLLGGSGKSKAPNILFIAIDDLRPELGLYGNKIVQSPNLDKLAQEGLTFDNHYVQVPTCGASRYALLTGYRPRNIRHLKNDIFSKEMADAPETEHSESFVHQLKRNGYHTVGIGKISHSTDGLLYGYEDEVSDKKEMPYSWDEFLLNSGLWGTGWNAFFGYANGENRQSLQRKVKPYEAGDVDDNGYVDGLTTQLAIEKLKDLKELGEPFFLGVGFFKPHLPFNAPKKYWDLYDREEIPIAPDQFIPSGVNLASLHNSGELNGYLLTDEKADLSKPLSDRYSRKLVHAYYASISYIDAQVGLVMDELKRLELADNTIIVVWGDHGWHLGNDNVWGKHTLFETALRSALIMKVPNGRKGSTKAIIETVDIYPTLMDLCDVVIPPHLDGSSFKELIMSEEGTVSGHEVAYSYFKRGISMRNDRYRLTKYYRTQGPTIELYDHASDPYESLNVANKLPHVVKELLPILERGNTGLYE